MDTNINNNLKYTLARYQARSRSRKKDNIGLWTFVAFMGAIAVYVPYVAYYASSYHSAASVEMHDSTPASSTPYVGP